MARQSFLDVDVRSIRHSISGILDSYSHDWDLLAELCQNAVDAVRAAEVKKGRFNLLINARERVVEISDNGEGIKPDLLVGLLRLFATGKQGRANQIGEKGVGLKFVIFSSSQFQLQTRCEEGCSSLTIENAAAWADSTTDEMIEADVDHSDGQPYSGTTIRFTIADPEHPLLSYTFEECIFLLRTKTAFGDAGSIWGRPLAADVEFTHVDRGGDVKSRTFDCRYLLPIERCKKGAVQDLEGFEEWVKDGDRTDADKRRRLQNKIIFLSGHKNANNREIEYWSCFVPSRDQWRKLSEAEGLIFHEGKSPHVQFSGGCELATRGMPASVTLELKPRGSAGYIPNFFVLINDPALKFDIGRKAIHGRQQGLLREIAQECFRKFDNVARKYIGGEADTEIPEWNRDEIFAEIETLPNLASESSRFLKRPNSQEATVVAMFFELLGRGSFSGFRPLISGYRARHDVYGLWENRRITLEFKYDLAGLLRDCNDERKLFHEINVLVLWEITERDRELAARVGIGIDALGEGLEKRRFFPEATFQLTLGGVSPIYVIELRKLISN